MRRVVCHLLGCRWDFVAWLPEKDVRWDRKLWRCGRCGDERKVWVGWGRDHRPDRVYVSASSQPESRTLHDHT